MLVLMCCKGYNSHRNLIKVITVAQKTKAKTSKKKTTKQPKLKQYILGRSRMFYIIATLFVLVFAAYGAWQFTNSKADTYALTLDQCLIRGRAWGGTSGVCTDNCLNGAGVFIKNVGEYGYCGAAITETVGRDQCDNLGRKYVGLVGCARRWQQTQLKGAMQCQSSNDTYYIAAYDHCDDGAGWVWPLPSTHRVTTLWGESTSKGIHKGIDIGASGGASLYAHVVAAHSGTVTQSFDGGACGWMMVIKARNTIYWDAYQHLEKGSAQVSPGNFVHAGDYIARVGTAGGSTCGSAGFYHLHFSVEKGNWISWYSSPLSMSINPYNVLPH